MKIPHIEIIVENEEINIKFSDKIEVFKINKEHKIKRRGKKRQYLIFRVRKQIK